MNAVGALARPEFTQAQAHLRRCLELDLTQEEALDLLFRSCEIDPKNASGSLFFLEQTLTRLPNRFDLKLNLASIFERAGQPEKGQALLRELAAQDVQPRIADTACLQLVAMADLQARKKFRVGLDALQAGNKDEGQKMIAEAIQ
jgi:thioredoxin-like negative regulator of GroEL